MVSCNNWSSNSNFQIGSWKWEQNKISFKLLNLNCFHKPDFFLWILNFTNKIFLVTMYGAKIQENQKNRPIILSFFKRLNSMLRMASIFSLKDISQAYNFRIWKKMTNPYLQNRFAKQKQIFPKLNHRNT